MGREGDGGGGACGPIWKRAVKDVEAAKLGGLVLEVPVGLVRAVPVCAAGTCRVEGAGSAALDFELELSPANSVCQATAP